MSNQEKNLLLLKQFQNGDEFAFEELFRKNQGLIISVLKKFSNLKYIDDQQKISLCYKGFMKACETYDTVNPKSTFSHYVFKGMGACIIEENRNMQFKGRQSMMQASVSMNINNSDDDFSLDSIKGEEDNYFEGEFPSLKTAIQYALEKCQNDKIKEYLLLLTLEEYSQQEVADLTGESRQVVNYQVKKFKENIKKYIELNKEEQYV